MKVQFDTGMYFPDAHKAMAKEARRISQSYSDKSAAHYNAWLRLAEALEGAAELAATNPGDPPPKLKTKLLR